MTLSEIAFQAEECSISRSTYIRSAEYFFAYSIPTRLSGECIIFEIRGVICK